MNNINVSIQSSPSTVCRCKRQDGQDMNPASEIFKEFSVMASEEYRRCSHVREGEVDNTDQRQADKLPNKVTPFFRF